MPGAHRQPNLNAAARLFGEIDGERTTLRMISEAVGLSKMRVYCCVRRKEDLLGRLLADLIDALAAQDATGPRWQP